MYTRSSFFQTSPQALTFFERRLYEPSKPPIDACFVDLNLDPEDSSGLLSHRKAVITILGSIFGVQHASLRVTRAQ